MVCIIKDVNNMNKYIVYYKSNGKVIKEFISFRFALHFRE